MVSLVMLEVSALSMARRRRGLFLGSGSPRRAAVVISRIKRVNSLHAFVAFTPAVDGWMATTVYAIAAYLALTALLGMCVIYKLLDVNTHDQEATYYSGEDVFDGRGGD